PVLLAAVSAAIVTPPHAGIAIDGFTIVGAVVVVTPIVAATIVVPVAIAVAVALPRVFHGRCAVSGSVEVESRGGERGYGQARSDQGQGSLCNYGFHVLGSYQTTCGRLISTPRFLNSGQLSHSETDFLSVACSAGRTSLTLRP